MIHVPALLIRKSALESDSALREGARGARKLIVTELFERKECEASNIEWRAPADNEKCPVQVMADSEVGIFNQFASQDRHFHEKGTEIYIVIDGSMTIEIQGIDYSLHGGDMIVVNPGTIHEVKPDGLVFLCRVVTLNCGGSKDKFVS